MEGTDLELTLMRNTLQLREDDFHRTEARETAIFFGEEPPSQSMIATIRKMKKLQLHQLQLMSQIYLLGHQRKWNKPAFLHFFLILNLSPFTNYYPISLI